MAGYTRQSTYTDGDVINAADSNDEFDQLVNAFANTTGHAHDGTANEGPVIKLIGDAGDTTPTNKVEVDTANSRVGVFVDVSASSVEQIRIQDGAIVPVTDDDVDLGASGAEFKDLYIDGTANVDALVIGTSTGVTSVDTDISSVSASDDTLASAKAIKTYVDAQVTAQDLDFQADTGGALNIDLDSETLTLTGGTGIDTAGAGNAVTFAIDSTVATLTGTQTLTNKTLTSPVIGTISNTGTLTLPTSTDTLVGRATTDTLTNKTVDADNNTLSNVEVDNFKASAIVTEAEGISSNDNDTTLPTSAAVKDYVDNSVTAQDLDLTTDSGTIDIDLDSETLTVAGGTGIDSSATGTTVTLAIDSTVATLTGTQTLTNKTLTAPVISTISNTGTVTLPTSTDTLVARDTTDTLTNKTLDTANNTVTIDLSEASVTGTTAEFNTALSDGSFATLAGTETLTNKTLTSPTIDLSTVTSSGDLAIADGGTGGSTASDARDNLGLTIGTDVQAYDAGLASIAGLTTSADQAIYTTASDTYAVTSLTSFGRSLIDDADASTARTTLGLGTAATLNVGTSANNVVQLDGTGKLPAVDGSQLTNISFTETDPSALAFAIALG